MADFLNISVDSAALLAALDRVGKGVEKHLKDAAEETAYRIRDEQRRRIARRTGDTAARLIVEETYDKTGFAVLDDNQGLRRGDADIERFLERGTRYMVARPFFDNAAKIEEEPHRRRVDAAVQKAIEEQGLGG